MITVQQFITEQSNRLAPQYGEGEARSMLLLLLEEYLSCDRSTLLFESKDTLLSTDALACLGEAIQALEGGEPLQYILGYTYFFDQRVEVAPGVLIPRPETEELVYLIKQDLALAPATRRRILDIGTGSACIPVGLASQIGERHIGQIDAIDFSPEALAVAELNIQRMRGAYPDINFQLVEQDVFAISSETEHLGGYDLIVSNPPYIHPKEAEEMSASVLDWEPSSALFTPEEYPTLYYEQIARLACRQDFLRDRGHIYLELNPLYAEATEQSMLAILSPHRKLQSSTLITDMSGKQRFLHLTLA